MLNITDMYDFCPGYVSKLGKENINLEVAVGETGEDWNIFHICCKL